jgi:hypothetical protein
MEGRGNANYPKESEGGVESFGSTLHWGNFKCIYLNFYISFFQNKFFAYTKVLIGHKTDSN